MRHREETLCSKVVKEVWGQVASFYSQARFMLGNNLSWGRDWTKIFKPKMIQPGRCFRKIVLIPG
jgi:hypothetical protein